MSRGEMSYTHLNCGSGWASAPAIDSDVDLVLTSRPLPLDKRRRRRVSDLSTNASVTARLLYFCRSLVSAAASKFNVELLKPVDRILKCIPVYSAYIS